MTNLQIALIKYREKNKLNQTELANLLGYTRSAVANWETGRTTPKVEIYVEIAKKLNVSTDYLLGKSDDRNNTSSLPKNMSDVQVAFYNQSGKLTEDQMKVVLEFMQFLDSKEKK